jgi:hypothetical protein
MKSTLEKHGVDSLNLFFLNKNWENFGKFWGFSVNLIYYYFYFWEKCAKFFLYHKIEIKKTLLRQ